MRNEQPSRFTDSDSEMGIWRLGSIDKTRSNSKTVFPGQGADDRMREVRRAISDIRLSWGRYAQFRDELKDFVERQAEPKLWDISVYGMDPAYLASYRRSFPHSIVTSMCAVPINGLSYYHVEDEVLLRGPFFQIVRMHEDSLQGEALHVIQAVMLNSNRDHVTAIANNEGEDLRMREIFRDMAIASRSARCAQHAERCGLTADAEYYRSEAAHARTGFSDLM